MKGIYFEKVSFETFLKDVDGTYFSSHIRKNAKIEGKTFEEYVKEKYDKIKLPKRKTKCSAGYDFATPFEIDYSKIDPSDVVAIPTGIKAHMPDDIVLQMHIRSSMGIHRINIANTVGIIDADYYNNESNEGDILIALVNTGRSQMTIGEGDRISQGIFTKYYTTQDDDSNELRTGGYGSTN